MKNQLKTAVVCCSNGQPTENKSKVELLKNKLENLGLNPIFSDFIYKREGVFSGSPEERADALMSFYKNEEIKEIFDISGGDVANEILPYLDFEIISKSEKRFWGYSDLTTIINAIYAKTGKKSVLYQIRNLVGDCSQQQMNNFSDTLIYGKRGLFDFNYTFVQGEGMKGVVLGGNIRCLLKLAGTEYFPDMNGKILLLESRGGTVPQMTTYLSQLKQIGVFGQINGIVLGTFTKMEQEKCSPDITELVKGYAGSRLPIVKTNEIGHGADSKGIVIGEEIALTKHDA